MYYPGQNNMNFQRPQKDVMAIISMSFGIISIILLCCCGGGALTGIVSLVMGLISRKNIRESNGMKAGEGFALAGIITGAVAIALGVLVFIYCLVSGFMHGFMQGFQDSFRNNNM